MSRGKKTTAAGTSPDGAPAEPDKEALQALFAKFVARQNALLAESTTAKRDKRAARPAKDAS